MAAPSASEVLASSPVDVQEALADLMEISSQVEAAVVLDESGAPLGSTLPDEGRAAELARAGAALLEVAARVRPSAPPPVQVDAATRAGSVFVVREAGRTIAATTAPAPTVGLVFYDLKTCLRALAANDGAAKAKPRQRRKRDGGDADAAA